MRKKQYSLTGVCAAVMIGIFASVTSEASQSLFDRLSDGQEKSTGVSAGAEDAPQDTAEDMTENVTESLAEDITENPADADDDGGERTLPFVSKIRGDNGEILPDTVGETEEQDTGDDTEFHLDIDYILSYDQQQCSDMIFFGDSRVVGMSYYAGGYHYVGKVSMGLSWMNGEGRNWLDSMISQFPQADIVVCFGINDLGNVQGYISSFQSLIDSYPERFWFMSVNPVSEASAARNGYSVRNSMIESFNAQIGSAFPDRYLDCYSYLMQYGVESPDGVHYSGTTYAAVEDYAWRAITEKLEAENKEK